MSWNVKVEGDSKSDAMSKFNDDRGSAYVPESVKDFIDQALAGISDGMGVRITTYGHLSVGDNGYGASNVTVTVEQVDKG